MVIKLFKKWFDQRIQNSIDRSRSEEKISSRLSIPVAVDDSTLDQERAIRLNIYHASGGRIVETRRYDHQKDRTITSLYIVTNDQEFGKEVDKIITMESLK